MLAGEPRIPRYYFSNEDAEDYNSAAVTSAKTQTWITGGDTAIAPRGSSAGRVLLADGHHLRLLVNDKAPVFLNRVDVGGDPAGGAGIEVVEPVAPHIPHRQDYRCSSSGETNATYPGTRVRVEDDQLLRTATELQWGSIRATASQPR